MMNLTFDDFKKLAKNDNLKGFEKVGFGKEHREGVEEQIIFDIYDKISPLMDNTKLLDIGCGCSKVTQMIIDRTSHDGHQLYLVDSEEMLSNISNYSHVIKMPCEFPKCKELVDMRKSFDAIIIYSVLHHIVEHGNYICFLDSAIELLKVGGKLLIGDIPNYTKKQRFLTSDFGINFHKEWSGNDELPETTHNTLVKNIIDDSIIYQILARYRNMGCDTYLLPQKEGLALNHTREDILIVKIND